MRKINKALVAVSIVAAMCLVPVFAIADDSEAAATLTTGENGASFEIDSIDDDKFNGFVTDDFKEHIMITFIGTLIGSAYFTTTPSLMDATPQATSRSVAELLIPTVVRGSM